MKWGNFCHCGSLFPPLNKKVICDFFASHFWLFSHSYKLISYNSEKKSQNRVVKSDSNRVLRLTWGLLLFYWGCFVTIPQLYNQEDLDIIKGWKWHFSYLLPSCVTRMTWRRVNDIFDAEDMETVLCVVKCVLLQIENNHLHRNPAHFSSPACMGGFSISVKTTPSHRDNPSVKFILGKMVEKHSRKRMYLLVDKQINPAKSLSFLYICSFCLWSPFAGRSRLTEQFHEATGC